MPLLNLNQLSPDQHAALQRYLTGVPGDDEVIRAEYSDPIEWRPDRGQYLAPVNGQTVELPDDHPAGTVHPIIDNERAMIVRLSDDIYPFRVLCLQWRGTRWWVIPMAQWPVDTINRVNA